MTPREAGEYRRASDAPWYWQLVHFVGAPLVDHWQGLSLTRLIAAVFAGLVCYVSVRTTHISAGSVTLAIFSIATAFGKTVFTAALQRWGASSVSVDSKTIVDATVREIQERRDAGGGIYEPTHE